MVHVARLTRQLQVLLAAQRVAALGTIADDGGPLVSMVPFAVEPGLGVFVIHVSGLAAHSRHLQARPRVSLLVMQPPAAGEPVHALPRVTFDGQARVPAPGGDDWRSCRQAYVERFPEAAFMTELGDFRFVAIEPASARQVAGFGAARSIAGAEVRLALQAPSG
ncbi:MAG TPA: pyridoxamine 5'-phosphate oxidase family protein [Ramlibacter sp.]